MLFSRIEFDDIDFLDLFGGTGNHCYEMISRGAGSATYVDQFGQCVSFAKKMAKELAIEDQMKIIRSDVRKYVAACDISYDVIFAGPPYGLKWLDDIPDLILNNSLLKEDGLLILEHNPDHNFESHSRFVETRNYGQTFFSFFK